MKTSNKILLFIGIALLVSPFINAYSLKQKLDRKEYTLQTDLNRKPTEFVSVVPFDSIHIVGNNNLFVKIIQSDTLSIEKGVEADVFIKQENGVLSISPKEGKEDRNRSEQNVTIKTPSLNVLSFEGKLIVDSVGNKYRNTVSKYFSYFKIMVSEFTSDQLSIHGLNGGGNIDLLNNQLKSLSIHLGASSNFQIDSASHVDSMDIEAAKHSSITLDGTSVKSLTTRLDPEAGIIIRGNKVEKVTPLNLSQH